MNIDGGSVQTLVSGIPTALGGSWNSDGTIIFGNNPGGPIFRISATGGEPVAATRVEAPRQRGHASPVFLPDGRHFLFFVTGIPEVRGVYLGELDRLDATRLFDADAPAVYAATGDLLFIRDGKLLAQAFDPDSLELRGDPTTIADQVSGGTALSASVAGTIAYRTAPADSGQRQLVWVDRSGREIDKEVYPDTAAGGPAWSHDGRRIAVYRLVNGNMDIWSYETSRRAWERITFGAGDDIYPLWSRDGSSIVSGSVRTTNIVDIYRTFSSAQVREEPLLVTSQPKFPMDWSADGRFLLYDSLDPKRGFDMWALPLGGDGAGAAKPFEVVQTDFNEGLAQFSPDRPWIAYQSDKTGRFEIYLRPFPGPGSDTLVSTAGGGQVRWGPDGKELFYVGTDDRLMAVPISFSPDGKSVEFGTPTGLFTTNVGSTAVNVYRQQYAVSPDGRSFVMHSFAGDASASPITVILNRKPGNRR
jgi:Tol biopolymer transport system component